MSDRPAPSEHLHDGAPAVPRPAATVVILRGGDEHLSVLLVRRNPAARFMGGAWVFPGGAVDAADGAGEAGSRAAAVREVREEAGLRLSGPDALVPFARWITPARIATRFDTWFYLAHAPAGQDARPDGRECVDARWLAPARALEARRAGELDLMVPTIKVLEQLSGFASAAAATEWAAGRTIEPVEPRVEGSGENARVVLPGDG